MSQTLKCSYCGQKLEGGNERVGMEYDCPNCGNSLTAPSSANEPATAAPRGSPHAEKKRSVMLAALLATTLCVMFVTQSVLMKDFDGIRQKQAYETKVLREHHKKALTKRRAELEAELAAVDEAALHRSAKEHYKEELIGRRSYERRFALSSRERAQLHMKAFASDSTKSFHDAIRAVAREASPKGADISVRESAHGIELHIDFDMSSMTSGEHGTRTKHHTKDSLRKEAISLISRVTNDVFQFCKDLNLASIHVGCRHLVQTKYQYGRTREKNTTLYKISIRKGNIGKFTNNPFLDVYSTTQHFEIEEDNFDSIEIMIKKL